MKNLPMLPLPLDERATRITAIQNLDIMGVKASKPKTQKEAENVARSFKPITNKTDGRIAEIPINTIGKIFGHKGYDITQIIEHIPSLYETSVLAWSEPEIQREGHKKHQNIKAYHHYVNKFDDGKGEYFIRFSLYEEKTKHGKIGKNIIHSTAISHTARYKNGDGSHRIRDYLHGRNELVAFHDSRLTDFFNSVK